MTRRLKHYAFFETPSKNVPAAIFRILTFHDGHRSKALKASKTRWTEGDGDSTNEAKRSPPQRDLHDENGECAARNSSAICTVTVSSVLVTGQLFVFPPLCTFSLSPIIFGLPPIAYIYVYVHINATYLSIFRVNINSVYTDNVQKYDSVAATAVLYIYDTRRKRARDTLILITTNRPPKFCRVSPGPSHHHLPASPCFVTTRTPAAK